MKIRLKPLRGQVMVITGATSGIGLAIARGAATRGARLVVSARNDEALEQLVREISAAGGEALAVAADVGVEAEAQHLADAAIERFGGFDTWINNAGVSIYGPLLEVSSEDHRRLFDTNYWGVVYGSLIAARHLRDHGGALINIGSVLSDRAVPIHGAYCASKHAVKGFTDALRMELEQAGAPVSVTLIKPSALDTPYVEHAKNYLEEEPRNPPPLYSAQLVADAVLHAAQHPIRDLVVGGGGRLLTLAGALAPRLTDKLMESTLIRLQHSGEPASARSLNSLHSPGKDGVVPGGYPGPVLQRSWYTAASRRPVVIAALATAAGILLWAALSRRASRQEEFSGRGTGQQTGPKDSEA